MMRLVLAITITTIILSLTNLYAQQQTSCEDRADGLTIQYGNTLAAVGQLRQELRRVQGELERVKKELENVKSKPEPSKPEPEKK